MSRQSSTNNYKIFPKTRMGPDEHVISTHVMFTDVARVNKFEPDPPKQVNRGRQGSVNNYKIPPKIRMGPDKRVMGTHMTFRVAMRVNK